MKGTENCSFLDKSMFSGKVKRKGKDKKWHNRYMILENCTVTIYHDENRSKIDKSFQLNETLRVNEITSNKQCYKFSIRIGGFCDFEIKTDTEEEKNYWINAFNSLTNLPEFKFREYFDGIKVIGRGKYGKVMLARQKSTNMEVAVKAIRKSNVEVSNQSVLMEKNALIRSEHNFVVKLFSSFQTSKKFYFVMELVSGGDLRHHLAKAGRIDVESAKIYIAELLLALEYLHSHGIIHRDLKPENILLDETGHVKIVDFGLAKILQTPDSSTNTFCGTLDYLAPEVIQNKQYSTAIDIWSLGIIAYELVFGKTPFHSDNESVMCRYITSKKNLDLPPDTDQHFASFLEEVLNKDQFERPSAVSLKEHQFFEGIIFDDLYNRQIRPFFSPSNDLKENFEKQFLDEQTDDSVNGTPFYLCSDFSFTNAPAFRSSLG